MRKKTFAITILLIISILSINSYSNSINIWETIEDAKKYEENKEVERAAKKWHLIVKYFEDQPESQDNHKNLAVFYKKLGHFYDQQKMYPKAVKYYEKENQHWLAAGKNWGAEDMIRADEIRTTVEYYAKTDISKRNLEKYEPASGIYSGIYSENDKKIGQNFYKTKDVYGPHSLYLLYQDWSKRFKYSSKPNSPIEDRLYKRADSQSAGVQIAMNAPDGLESIKKDEWIIEWAKEANKLDMPIFLRFLGEMNGDWVSYSNNPKLYIEKFRLVHDIIEKHAPNVAMVWCPNDVPVESNGYRIEDYYPGDDYVDWVGVNFYIDYYDSGNTQEANNRLQNPLNHLDYVYDLYADKKPIMICETGITHYSIPNQEDLTDWAATNLKKLYLQLPFKYPRVKAINYFSLNQANDNYKVGNRWNNYALSENSKVEETYKEILKNEEYLGKINQEIDFTYEQLKSPEAFSDKSEVFFFLKIPDYKISRVDFFTNDKLISSDKSLPFSLNADFSKIDTLTMKIYNSSNKLALKKKMTINSKKDNEEMKDSNISGPSEENIEKKIENTTDTKDSSKIKVSIPSFDVSVNSFTINNKEAKYPFITYKDITYFPMTYNYSKALGLSTNWSSSSGLVIKQNADLKGKINYSKIEKSGTVSKNATIPTYPIVVNGKKLDNQTEKYPILNINNITYFPLTWKFTVEEFGWSSKWDSTTGLKINR